MFRWNGFSRDIAVFHSRMEMNVCARAYRYVNERDANLNGIPYAKIRNLNTKIISKIPSIIHLTMKCMQQGKNERRIEK